MADKRPRILIKLTKENAPVGIVGEPVFDKEFIFNPDGTYDVNYILKEPKVKKDLGGAE